MNIEHCMKLRLRYQYIHELINSLHFFFFRWRKFYFLILFSVCNHHFQAKIIFFLFLSSFFKIPSVSLYAIISHSFIHSQAKSGCYVKKCKLSIYSFAFFLLATFFFVHSTSYRQHFLYRWHS